MDDARWNEAQEQLRQASHGFEAAEEATGEAEAQAMLALCGQAMGNQAARDAAAERARKLRQSINSRQEVYGVDIALVRLGGEAGKDASAEEKLLAMAADAERRQWPRWSLEAKLAAWRLMQTRGASATALRSDIETAARRQGFGRVLNLIRQSETERSKKPII
jgi:hypothetical protein